MQIRGAVDCIIIIQNYGSKKRKQMRAKTHLLHCICFTFSLSASFCVHLNLLFKLQYLTKTEQVEVRACNTANNSANWDGTHLDQWKRF